MNDNNNEVPTEDDIVRWLRLVVEPGDVVELRLIRCVGNPEYPPFTVAGWFHSDHLDELAIAAMELTGRAEGCYTTLNPTNPALLARAYNRVIRRPRNTTTDADIVRRVGLVFDVDPTRPAGISSTDAEKAMARERIDRLVDCLTVYGFPLPALIDSGNGFHARYKIDLAADDEGLVARVLKAADVLFSNEHAKIDVTLSNASRIVKLPGTLSRKGDDIPDRPHRWSQVLFYPEEFQVVPKELLEAFADEAETVVPAGKPPQAVQSGGAGSHQERTLSHDRRSPVARARAYVFAPGFPESVAGQGGHRQLYHAAACLVDGFGLTFDQALPIFQDWNQERAVPPESDRHVHRTLNDAIGSNPTPTLKLLKADRPSNT